MHADVIDVDPQTPDTEFDKIGKKAATKHYKTANFSFHPYIIHRFNNLVISINIHLTVKHSTCISNTCLHTLIQHLPIVCFYIIMTMFPVTKCTLCVSVI